MKKYIWWVILLGILFPCITVSAAETVKIKCNGETIKYSGVQVNTIMVNQTGLDISKTIGIKQEGYILLPFTNVFVNSELKATYEYDNASDFSITYGGKTLSMTLGSKVGYLDGKKVTLPVAPRKVYYKASKKTRILVPAKFVSKKLGITYEWDKRNKIVTLTAKPSSNNSTAGDITTDDTITGGNTQVPTESSVYISKDSNLEIGGYSTVDDYLNKRFVLILNGDYTEFYKQNIPQNIDGNAKNITVSLNQDGNTEISIYTSVIKAFLIEETEEAYYITIKNPKEVYSNILVLDAGHGGTDPGAVGNSLLEKDVTLKIVQYAKKYFDADNSIKVYYTREDDTYPTLSERAALANEVEADAFVSVHINAATSTTAKGTEVYYSSSNNQVSSSGLTGKKLAEIALTNLLKAVGSTNRGVKSANFTVIYKSKMPATLLEVAFISNKSDAAILKSEQSLDKIGKSVYTSIIQAFNEYPNKR